MRRRYPRGFGGPPKPPVKQTSGIQAGRRSKCQACQLHIELGQPFARLQLQKRYRTACGSCGTVPKRAKRYHETCLPTDINFAMGYDPTKGQPAYVPPAQQRAATPPPKPQTWQEAGLVAIAQLENVFVLKIQKMNITPEMESAFKKFQGIKAQVLRPGTPVEGELAIGTALQRIVKMVFNS